ncbi:MAG: 16S rRNA (guanine(527)-N(7))-methyltransferase RsmG [Roseovarius sp.]
MTQEVAHLNVSRETSERLHVYADLLRAWNPKINLVAPSTLDDLWRRHFVDSAQLLKLAPPTFDHWADLGTGAGFPGLVIAILVQDRAQTSNITLVESDARKSAFLRTVLHETGVTASILTARAEAVPPLKASVVSARALAPLTKLLGFTHRHLAPDGIALLPKGQNWKKEVREAQSAWQFSYRTDKSVLQESSVILSVTGVDRV